MNTHRATVAALCALCALCADSRSVRGDGEAQADVLSVRRPSGPVAQSDSGVLVIATKNGNRTINPQKYI